jgi:hypothetical protein
MATTFKPVGANGAGESSNITVQAFTNYEFLTALKNGSDNLELIGWRVANDKITRAADSGQQAGTVEEVALSLLGRRAVTAVRSGSGNLLLISWNVPLQIPAVTRLHDSGNQAGAATNIAMTAISDSILVTALRAGDGHLLLITWQLNSDGSFTRLADSGTQAGAVSVVTIVSTSDSIVKGVVTAVRNGSGILELISWTIASDGKKITRKADSAKLAGGVSEIAIGRGGPGLLTAVKNASGNLEVIVWRLGAGIERLGSIEAGTADHIAIASSGFGQPIASMRRGTGDLELIAFNVAGNGGITRTGDYGPVQNFDVTETALIGFGAGVLTAIRKANFLNLELWDISNSQALTADSHS